MTTATDQIKAAAKPPKSSPTEIDLTLQRALEISGMMPDEPKFQYGQVVQVLEYPGAYGVVIGRMVEREEIPAATAEDPDAVISAPVWEYFVQLTEDTELRDYLNNGHDTGCHICFSDDQLKAFDPAVHPEDATALQATGRIVRTQTKR